MLQFFQSLCYYQQTQILYQKFQQASELEKTEDALKLINQLVQLRPYDKGLRLERGQLLLKMQQNQPEAAQPQLGHP